MVVLDFQKNLNIFKIYTSKGMYLYQTSFLKDVQLLNHKPLGVDIRPQKRLLVRQMFTLKEVWFNKIFFKVTILQRLMLMHLFFYNRILIINNISQF